MHGDNLHVVIPKYAGHLILYNVLQHVITFNLKL